MRACGSGCVRQAVPNAPFLSLDHRLRRLAPCLTPGAGPPTLQAQAGDGAAAAALHRELHCDALKGLEGELRVGLGRPASAHHAAARQLRAQATARLHMIR